MDMKKVKLPFEVIELEEDSYHILLEIKLPNGAEGYAVIDTGASKTVLDKEFVGTEYKYEENDTEMTSGGLGGDIGEIKLITPEYILLENFEIVKPKLAVLDLSAINELYQQHCNKTISALIGSDFLVRYKAIIDYGKKQMTFTL